MSPLVQAPAVGAVAAAPEALMVAAIIRAALLPRKAKLALQFSGIARTQVARRKAPFCHAERRQVPELALMVRRIWHANVSADQVLGTETSVLQSSVTEIYVGGGARDDVTALVTDRPGPARAEGFSI